MSISRHPVRAISFVLCVSWTLLLHRSYALTPIVPQRSLIATLSSAGSKRSPFCSATHAHNLSPQRTQLQMAVSYESLMEKIPSQAVIKAVENAPNGNVVASDVATAAGISLSQARKDLTALASLTKGDIAVSNDGDLIYSFPTNINSVLSTNSAKYRALELFAKAKPILFYLVRVSFGAVLLASLFAIFSTIMFISASSSSSDDNRRDNRRGGGMSPFGGGGMGYGFWGPSPFDFFYYRPYYGYYASRPGERRNPDEMGFLESTFSYVFGDGNPNEQLEERRLSLAAKTIRENYGAVSAEQLAPFCDDAPKPDMGEERAYVDESFVLPIVTQLNGEPRVTEEGDIVYVFPELQVSASSGTNVKIVDDVAFTLKRAGLSPDASAGEINTLLRLNGISTRGAFEKKDLVQILAKALPPPTDRDMIELEEDEPDMLMEKEYRFSLAPDGNRFMAGGLGVINLLGALYLGGQLNFYANYGVKLPEFFGVVQSAYPLLLSYAIAFNVIPLARTFWIKAQNILIQDRNRKRRLWKTALTSGAGRINRKLQSAKKFGTKMKKLGYKDIYFDTSKPMEVIDMERKLGELDEFDSSLGI